MNGGAFVTIASPGPRANTGNVTYVDTTVAAGDTYAYRVKAVNGAVSSAYSNTATLVLPAPPAAPSNLTAAALPAKGNGNNRQAALTWVDNASNETGFTIQRSTNANFNANLVTTNVAANLTSATLTGLPRRTTLYFRIRANNGAGPSAWSNSASVTTP